MDVCEWLNSYKKTEELIIGKRAEKNQLQNERQRLIDIATDISAKMPDGMPHSNTGTVSQKMQNAVIAKVLVDKELDKIDNAIRIYLEFKNKVITALEKLPEKEYAVLHRYYIRHMTMEAIAEDMGYADVRQIYNIKKNGLKLLENFIVFQV